MRLGRRAGEWELELPAESIQKLPLADLVRRFQESFPWVAFESFDVYDAQGVASWAPAAGAGLDAWLADRPEGAHGFEASLALALAWRSEAGDQGESWLPASACLLFDRESTLVTFTVWPNLFTDQVPLYEPTDHGYTARPARWDGAAESNRRRLETSLRQWEISSGGAIVSSTSELVDLVARHGFPPSAAPL
jgi:hypothetical protein